MIGQTISHYQILSKLGEGGMGVVYKALDTGLDREVALKFLPTSASRDAEAKERFMREAKSASALDHANICTIFEIGETDDGQLFMAMALYDGESLEDRLAEGPMQEDEAVDIARQVALGLAAAHEAGIVHRDIKPANVIITSKGVAKVLDFGVAKLGGSAALTQTGASVGTMIYMSPEQARGGDVDARADIWSLGGMLYEMISGSRPFSTGYDAAILYAILNEDPTPLKDLMPDVSEVVSDAVAKCLDKDREKRFTTAEELASALPGGAATTTIIVEKGTAPPSIARNLVIFAGVAVVLIGVIYGAMILLGLPDWVLPVGLVLVLAGLPIIGLSSQLDQRRASMRTNEREDLSGLQGWLTTGKAVKGGVFTMAGFGVMTAGFMLLRAMGIGGFATLITSGVLDKHDVIIVSDFVNRTNQDHLAEILTTAFRVDLSQSTAITVMEQKIQTETLGRMLLPPDTTVDLNIAMEMAERQGAKAVVTGELGQVGEGFLVSVGLVSVPDGTTLVRLRESAESESELIRTIDEISNNLRKEIGESIRNLRAEDPLEEVTTSSLEALRMFTESAKFQVQGNNAASLALLDQALELDSTFAMAHQNRGAVGLNTRDLSLARDGINKAYELRANLPIRERLISASLYYTFVESDSEQSIIALESILDRYPTDVSALNNLSNEYSFQNRHSEADSLLRVLLKSSNQAYVNLSLLQIDQGLFDEFDRVMDQWTVAEPGHPTQAIWSSWAEIAKRNLEAATEICDPLKDAPDPMVSYYCTIELAKIAAAKGQLDLHRSYIATLMASQKERGDAGGALMTGIDAVSDRLVATGHLASAESELNGILSETDIDTLVPETAPWSTLTSLYLELQDLSAAEKSYASLAPPLDTAEKFLTWPYLNARVTLLKDGTDSGIPVLERAFVRVPSQCRKCSYDYLGEAYEDAGRFDDAISAYEEYVTHINSAVIFRLAKEAIVLFRLGELYEENGDLSKAIENYTLFAERWKDADEELQPKVTEANRRIESLLDRMAREPAN